MNKKIIGILICMLFIGISISQINFFKSVKADQGDVIHQINYPGENAHGIAWDGSYIWAADSVDDKIYKLDPSDGNIVHSINSPGEMPYGLTWDGSYLWNTDYWSDKIYKIDPSDGTIIHIIDAPCDYAFGLTWDGSYLWVTNYNDDKIHKLSPSDGTIIQTINSPGGQPTGLTWDGSYLWNANQINHMIFKLRPSDGMIITSFEGPGLIPSGLTWDGNYLWYYDEETDIIYQIDVNEPNQPPVADANGPYYGDPGENITLDGTGSYDSDGYITLYEWDLDNDGQYDDATGATPTYSWPSGGTYTIKLRVWDDESDNDIDTTFVYTINQPPVADANGPYYGDKDEVIYLDGSGSSDVDGIIISYEWDLDDDGVFDDATGPTPSWSWSQLGIYIISLKVTDDDSETDTDISNVYIGNQPPLVYIRYPDEDDVLSGLIDISGTASDINGDDTLDMVKVHIDQGNWSIADGTKNWCYVWDTTQVEDGIHTISAVAIDDESAESDIKTVTVNVDNIPNQEPIVLITYPQDNTNISGVINISGIASDPDGNDTLTFVEIQIDNCSWMEANGTTVWSYLWNTSEVENGLHTITAKSYDGQLNSSFDTVNVTVGNQLDIFGYCPIDLKIIDPNGFSINKTSSSIIDATYEESDLDGDGEIDDHVHIPNALQGEYQIKVNPEPGADSNELFSLDAVYLGNTYHIIQDTRIADAPEEGYVFNTANIGLLCIDDIRGGFGFSADIKNICTATANDVNWFIDVEKNIALILSGEHTVDVIDELASGDLETIQSDGLRGIGFITITVQVADVVKTATAFLLGPLVLRVNEI